MVMVIMEGRESGGFAAYRQKVEALKRNASWVGIGEIHRDGI